MKYRFQALLTHEAESNFVFTKYHLEPRGVQIQRHMALRTWVQRRCDVQLAGETRAEWSRLWARTGSSRKLFQRAPKKTGSPQKWKGSQALIKPYVESGRRKAVPGPEQIANAQLQGVSGDDQKQKEECVNMVSGLRF